MSSESYSTESTGAPEVQTAAIRHSAANKTSYVSVQLSTTNYVVWEKEMQYVFSDEGCKAEPLEVGNAKAQNVNPYRITNTDRSARILLWSVNSEIRAALISRDGPISASIDTA